MSSTDGRTGRDVERAPQRSEQELSDFFENANVGLCLLAPDGTILRVNRAEIELLGYEADAYVGRNIRDIHVRPMDADDLLRQLALGNAVSDYRARLRCRDGSVKEVLINAMGVWEGEQLTQVRCFTLDVTARRRAEETRALLAAIVSASDDAIVSKTLDGEILSWNAAAERLFGYTPAEALGRQITLIIPPELWAEEEGILDRLRRGERVEHFETVRLAKDGTRFDVSLTVSPVWDEAGHIIGASKVARDITERKRTEQALRLSEERFRRMADAAPVMIWMTGPDKQCIWVNAQWLELVGRPLEQVIGDGWSEDIHEDDRAGCVQTYASAFEAGRPFSMEYRLRRHDGEFRWVLHTGTPSYGPEGALNGYIGSSLDITDLKHTEQALRTSEARYRALVESQAGMVCRFRTDGSVLFVNESYARARGTTPEALIGGNFWSFVLEEDRPAVRAMLEQLTPEAPEVRIENRIETVDGARWTLWVNRGLAFDPQGRLLEAQSVGVDISERKKTELALRESEERFARFMQHLPGLAWIKDLEGRYVYVNDAAQKVFRRPLSEIYGKTDAESFPKDVAAQFRRNDRKALATPSGVQAVEAFEHDDGTHYTLVSKFPIVDSEGNSTLVGGIAIDVTEAKRTEEALRDREAHLRAVFDTAMDGIIAFDEHGVIESVNPAVERLFGYGAAELIGRNVSMLMPEPYGSEHDGYLRNYRRTGRRKIIGVGREVMGCRKDGSVFPMDLAVSEFTRGNKPMFTGLVRDITERKQVEQALRDADRRKDEFIATLAHELRNPLAPIRNALEILKLAESDALLLRQGRETIERQLAHMVRLVDDLLDVGRITRDRLELRKSEVEIESIIIHAVETYRPLAEQEERRISVSLPSQPAYLEADPVRLAQVLSNLLNNACKYTPPGGRISVMAEQQASEVVIAVSDTGKGIPPEHLATIFDMFAQIPHEHEHSPSGLGIGLTLVKRLVELHGGSIEAHSDGPGLGSTFVVRLPAAPRRAQERLTPEASPPQLTASRRILVVDDNVDSADSLAALLRLGGHQITVAYDGAEALEAADRHRPDLILLDIGLPKLSGIDVCRRIRRHPWGSDVVIVALTGWGQEQDRRRSKEAGFDQHLVKPIDHATLLRVLAALPSPPRDVESVANEKSRAVPHPS